jgi:hypothetical protein
MESDTVSKTTGILGLSKPLYGTEPQIAADLDLLDAVLTAPRSVTNYAANGAITQKDGTVTISKASAAAMTLADPTAGTQVGGVGDDGKILRIVSKTAFAHVITITGGLQGGALNTSTFAAAVGSTLELEAIAGKWYTRPSVGSTLSTV